MTQNMRFKLLKDAMKAAVPKFVPKLLLGQVIQLSKIGVNQIPCVQIRCQQNDFYAHVKKYFVKSNDYWALDADSNSQLGDTVLMRRAEEEERPNATVQHVVDRIVFKHGVLIDPVTKKRVVRHEFVENLELKQHLMDDILLDPRASVEEPSRDRQKEIQRERLRRHRDA